MFSSDYKIYGKHANYWKDLCKLPGNVPDKDAHNNFKIFNSYVDAYILCPIIGYQFNRKGEKEGSSDQNAGMLADAVIKRQNELKYVYQIIMLVDEESEPDIDKRIYRAFNLSDNTEEEHKFIEENMKIFESYFLGGLEVLHEIFVDECIEEKDYLEKIHDFVTNFSIEQNANELQEEINKYING